MKFELLPNELILDLFEYLDAVHLLRTFYNLNSRFNELLMISFQSYHLDFRSVSKNDFNAICQEHLSSIINRTVSIYFANDDDTPHLPKHFLSYQFNLNQFLHLQSLSFHSIDSLEILNQIISQCPQIKHIQFIQCFFNEEVYQLINNIWSLPKLIDCRMDGLTSRGTCFTKLSIISESIKYLSIKNINCDCYQLSSVFQHTPYLQYLNTTIVCASEKETLQTSTSYLTKLILSFDGSLETMISLCESMCNLRSITLDTSHLLLTGIEWEHLLVQHFPHIQRFQLRMSFRCPGSDDLEDGMDQLLDTFQTDFWINKHRWFVRCDWKPFNSFHDVILYTLPYAFDDFKFTNETYSKSTCPNRETYSSYQHVRILQHESDLSYDFIYFPIRFPNISHLEIFLPFSANFLAHIPSLPHLTSLDVTLLPVDNVYDQLQILLNRASHLQLLRFSHLSDLEPRLFQISNTSIRRLDFFTKESILYSWYFNHEQCLALAQSTLGQQCRTLVIDIKNRANVIDIIDHMPNLQALTFRCKDDKWNYTVSGSGKDEFLQWLKEHLPMTCSISRQVGQHSMIQIWIR